MLSKLCNDVAATLSSRSGAVTVDFVVLTASIVTICYFLVIAPVYSGSIDMLTAVNDALVAFTARLFD